ncbi:acyl-CoA thioesterase [Amycolatopsis anabasis]|uniref:acyl-CoA thioesterase n=1 Tax=Amycolatopsis anabasis TaxID=1840409 RepID=UPI00131D1D01|nr:acyl-CoA thioesterase [Amycolatopsis anabasis]
MSAPVVHEHTVRIRPVDCDRQGVVHASRYAVFCEAAMVETLRAGLGDYRELERQNVDFVLAEFRIRYFAPARFDELLRFQVRADRVGETSLTIGFDGLVGDRRVVHAVARYVMVATDTGTKTPLIAGVRRMFGG